MSTLWNKCVTTLEAEIPSQQFNTWIRPLQAIEGTTELKLLAPNKFVLDWVKENFISRIEETVAELVDGTPPRIVLAIGAKKVKHERPVTKKVAKKRPEVDKKSVSTHLSPAFLFDNFVEGKSNQLAKAASIQVAENVGHAYNPLFIYGGVGLGKTHLMQAIGNMILAANPAASVTYLHSETFVGDMVKALQHNTIDAFKQHYRSLDALLIDDIQFFAGKERSQEEFFHTFNTLIEKKAQVVMTCDRYPKEIDGLEDRLKSRFGWGLPIAIEPPDLETRVAILMTKATQFKIELPREVAFMIGKRIPSNVRELEGALRRVIANANFTGKPITVEFAKEALKDLIAIQNRMTSIENIQKTVAEYFKIRVSDLHSRKRTRSITRPRQIAMSLAKELTSHSLPEIGEAFGGRDHTTVIHACKKVADLIESDDRISEDHANLLRTLAH